jgi:hypothetical protein
VAAWDAITATVPEPVSVIVEPEIVAGPDTIEYVNAPVEFELALTVNGVAPALWFAIANEIVGATA